LLLFATAGSAIAAPGAFDGSFGSGGAALNQLGTGTTPSSSGTVPAIQSDGKIVVAGYATDASGHDQLMLARFNTNGTVDTSFGTGGRVLTQLGSGPTPSSQALAVAIQSDGKIVVTGVATDASDLDELLVARFNTNGTLDSSFGTGGVLLTQLGGGSTAESEGIDLTIQTNGQIVIGGWATDASSHGAFMVARLNPNGTLDASFANAGVYTNQLSTASGSSIFSEVYAVALQPNGEIVATGYENYSGEASEMVLARLTTNGTPDPSFASGGVLITQPGAGATPTSTAFTVAIQPDGKLLFGGEGTDASGDEQLVVERLNTDGTPDTSFGTGGTFERQLSLGGTLPSSEADWILLQPDGKILLPADATGSNGNDEVIVTRLNSNGTTDTGYGTAGFTRAQFGIGGSTPFSFPYAAALQPNGDLVFSGSATDANGNEQLLVGRVLANPGPSAAFSYAPSKARLGVRTAFNASGSSDAYDPIIAYGWKFGDGSTGSGATARHTYKRPGTYTVTLAVVDADGLSAIITRTVKTAKPSLSHGKQSHKRWDESGKKAGTTFTFTLNETAKVTLVFKAGKHKKGTLTFNGRAGVNHFRFKGKLKHKHKLAPDTYTVTITAVDGSQHSNALHLKFTILS
jgi:uncharacterized delta-60 repeat protein